MSMCSPTTRAFLPAREVFGSDSATPAGMVWSGTVIALIKGKRHSPRRLSVFEAPPVRRTVEGPRLARTRCLVRCSSDRRCTCSLGVACGRWRVFRSKAVVGTPRRRDIDRTVGGVESAVEVASHEPAVLVQVPVVQPGFNPHLVVGAVDDSADFFDVESGSGGECLDVMASGR